MAYVWTATNLQKFLLIKLMELNCHCTTPQGIDPDLHDKACPFRTEVARLTAVASPVIAP